MIVVLECFIVLTANVDGLLLGWHLKNVEPGYRAQLWNWTCNYSKLSLYRSPCGRCWLKIWCWLQQRPASIAANRMLGGVYPINSFVQSLNDKLSVAVFCPVAANRFLFFAELMSATFCRPFEINSFWLLPRFVARRSAELMFVVPCCLCIECLIKLTLSRWSHNCRQTRLRQNDLSWESLCCPKYAACIKKIYVEPASFSNAA